MDSYKMEIKKNFPIRLGDLIEGDCFEIENDTNIYMVVEPKSESNGYVKIDCYCHVVGLSTGIGTMLRQDLIVRPVKLVLICN